jgi:hypothetical protein
MDIAKSVRRTNVPAKDYQMTKSMSENYAADEKTNHGEQVGRSEKFQARERVKPYPPELRFFTVLIVPAVGKPLGFNHAIKPTSTRVSRFGQLPIHEEKC